MQAFFAALQQTRAHILNRLTNRAKSLSEKSHVLSVQESPMGPMAWDIRLVPSLSVFAGKIVRMSSFALPKPHAEPRSAYRVLRPIPTRWSDNDVYGHVNNVVYYSWFDTAVNAYLIEQGVLDVHAGSTIGLVVETQCNYFASVAFPETVHAGIRVSKLGTSSVRYEIGIFGHGETTAAKGHFVHVYVDRLTRKPTPLPPALRQILETLL
jgi:acyl-CoA thioester hydrolase